MTFLSRFGFGGLSHVTIVICFTFRTMFKIPKLSAEEKVSMARRKKENEEKEKEEEEERKRKERADLSRRSGLNFGLQNPAMQKAGLKPLNRKKMWWAERTG